MEQPHDPNQRPGGPAPQPETPPPSHLPPALPSSASHPGSTNGLAIAGFVLAFLAPLIGLILSIIGLTKAKDHGGKGQGLAIAGIVISVIILPISLAFWLTVIAGVSQRAKENETNKTSSIQTTKPSNDRLELGKTYEEKTGAYSIKLPNGWEAKQPEGSRDLSAYPPISTEDYVSRLYLSVDKLYEGETFEEATASNRKTITEFSHGTITSETDITINGLKGRESIYTTDSGGRISSHYKIFLEKAGTLYAIEYETSPERSDAYLPVFKESTATFSAL